LTISSRQGIITGHLSLWRNQPAVNEFFRSVPTWREQLARPDHYWFDEDVITSYLRRQTELRVHWPEKKLNDYYDLEVQPYGWHWCEERLYDRAKREVFYLHFMTWKRYLKRIDFGVLDMPKEFWITRRAIWSKPSPATERVLQFLNYDRHFTSAIRVKRLLEQGVWATLGPEAKRAWQHRKRRQW